MKKSLRLEEEPGEVRGQEKENRSRAIETDPEGHAWESLFVCPQVARGERLFCLLWSPILNPGENLGAGLPRLSLRSQIDFKGKIILTKSFF